MDNNEKQKLIVIAGPTAVGKTRYSVELAKRIGAEIVSADSMQVYKYMDIGSAKVTKDEMQGIKHYLIDEVEPHEDYNVVRFQEMAKRSLDEIYSKGKIPILCGGTGFYIQALLYDIDFTAEDDKSQSDEIRAELEKTALEKGNAYVHSMLSEIDPESARLIPENNLKRVIRAIEFYRLHDEKISEHNMREAEKRSESKYDLRFFVLTDEREKLYKRIDQRVDKMLEAGLLEEVTKLKNMGILKSSTAMQGIGYRELYSYLDGEISLDEAIELIKRNSRHYAKRQLTWFKREQKVNWINISEIKEVTDEFEKYLW
ncbi:MAG: tRNA (adenosine(37)-N6)-dimethylallyltransferase MiaA [Eubacteriales bacterium]|nr:tRNA (adenosine(37)-N6)-dimethylallyltransferase MiaA [Eubacteriales bacterium]